MSFNEEDYALLDREKVACKEKRRGGLTTFSLPISF
jgi:hypothetical protein